MCGICGFYDRRKDAIRSEAELLRMGETIRHRGPDSHGSTLHGSAGLHSRRLSIIDVQGGDQPIFSADGNVAVVFNGEIFNFQELRRDLEARGHRFRTRSDTEVLVYLYLEHGPEKMLPMLNGFFAFALHDLRNDLLFVARDRLGVKPLYYAEMPWGLLFGSEIKPLLCEPSLSRELDPTALLDFLTLRYIPSPSSIFARVRKLPAGHYLKYDGTSVHLHPWWDLKEFGTRSGRAEDLAEQLWELVLNSVKLRLISEVPLGAFLSGGLDSSVVVAAMHEIQGSDVIAVSVGFEGWDRSELDHAKRVARFFDVRHVTAVLRPEVLRLVDRLAYFFDEPFADPSAIPTYLLAERTRKEVTVALSGDGGDESFAGYRRYRFDHWENRVRSYLPGPLFRSLFRLAGSLYPKADFLPQPLRARSTLQNLGRDPFSAYFHSVAARSVEEARALLSPETRAAVKDYDPRDRLAAWFHRAPTDDSLARVQYLDFHSYLPDYILVKSDRATMAHSLEAREPLLDYRIVEFAASLPTDMKLRSGVGKWLLKQAARPHLPPQTIDRKKQGFHPPLRQWIDHDLRGRVESLRAPLWIDASALESRVRAHRLGLSDQSELLYQMLVLQGFERAHLEPKESTSPVGS